MPKGEPISGLAVDISDPRAAFARPLSGPLSVEGLPLQTSVLSPWEDGVATPNTRLVLVYAGANVLHLPYGDALAAGAWFITEAPPRGGDLETIKWGLERVGQGDRVIEVDVGSHKGALLHQDPVNETQVRSYGLYWFDGTRDMSVVAVARSNKVIDVARSFYCD
jgi:hypothetical protein